MQTATSTGAVRYIADTLRFAARSYAHWIVTTDPDWLERIPGEPGVTKARSILDQAEECVGNCRRLAATLRGEELPKLGAIGSAEQAKAELIASADELASLIETRDDSILDEIIQTPFAPMPAKTVLTIVLGNLFYHGGVTNAYQLMYGDAEFRFPPLE